MKEYMLIFSLGPVQPFIEQARKTRDLWLGSFLLARLMQEAMQGLEELEAEFVFPFHKKSETPIENEHANFSNKYIAIFHDAKKADNAAVRSKKQIHNFWNALRANIKTQVVQWYADAETDKIWERQSNPERCFDIRWVVVEGERERYRAWLQEAEEAFEARKQLYNFQQQREPGEKSTISGERQALRRAESGKGSDLQQVRAFWEELANRKEHPPAFSAKEISLDGSERLDAIDTIKRFATKYPPIGEKPFPSTSSIATASFVEGLLVAAFEQNALRDWLQSTQPLRESAGTAKGIHLLAEKAGKNNEILRRDGDCFFRATFTPYRLEKDFGVKNKDEANQLVAKGRNTLNQLLKATAGSGLRLPTAYYAILKMDGDQISRLLGTAESLEEHREISGALSNFTQKDVADLVNKRYPGRLIYAGGDDVLAMAPLARNLPPKKGVDDQGEVQTVIDLANRLQLTYRERLKRGATASSSIAITHHYAPLSHALSVMRRAERSIAKKRYGRNALVVSVVRRSGSQTQVGCRWEYKQIADNPEAQQPLALFLRFYDLFMEDILSPKCVYTLLQEAPALVGLQHDAQVSEIKRVLLRQRSETKRNDLPNEEALQLAQRLVWLAEAMNTEHGFAHASLSLEADEPHHGLIEVFGWLLVMEFLTRKEED